MLRAAAVGGGAYMMGKRNAERSALQEPVPTPVGEQPVQEPVPGGPAGQPVQEPVPSSAAEQAAGSPGAVGPSSEDLARLQQLAKLNKEGVITDQELAEQKARILG